MCPPPSPWLAFCRVQAWTVPAGLGGVQINAALYQSTSCFSTYAPVTTYGASKAVDGVLQVLSAAETFYNSNGNGPQEFWQVVRSPHPRLRTTCPCRSPPPTIRSPAAAALCSSPTRRTWALRTASRT